MKTYLVDTNAVISYLTDRNPNQQAQILPYFEKAARRECELVIHFNVLTEAVYVLQKVYGVPLKDIHSILNTLQHAEGTRIVSESDLNGVLSLWPSSVQDFSDAVLADYAQLHPGMTVLTFDEKMQTALKKLGIAAGI